MRKKLVVANWKMNLRREEALILVQNVLGLLPDNNVEVVFSPAFTYLYKINKMCRSFDRVFTSSQNCSKNESGAFTGEISASMIDSLGTKYTILGHSERRELFTETNNDVKQKIDVALNNNLQIIFCCGESLDQRKKGIHFDWIESQLIDSLFHLDSKEFKKIVIAYEPVWAIGTGVTASSNQAEEMHLFIRNVICKQYGNNISDNCSILYGGSCNHLNAKELFSRSNIDGGLIGGASLDAGHFVDIIKSFE